MSQTIEVKVPDIGDYKDIPVIEVLVAVGDTVEAEQSLVTLESDKATMDVPSSAAGTTPAPPTRPRWRSWPRGRRRTPRRAAAGRR